VLGAFLAQGDGGKQRGVVLPRDRLLVFPEGGLEQLDIGLQPWNVEGNPSQGHGTGHLADLPLAFRPFVAVLEPDFQAVDRVIKGVFAYLLLEFRRHFGPTLAFHLVSDVF
jgi:hypothetical protein